MASRGSFPTMPPKIVGGSRDDAMTSATVCTASDYVIAARTSVRCWWPRGSAWRQRAPSLPPSTIRSPSPSVATRSPAYDVSAKPLPRHSRRKTSSRSTGSSTPAAPTVCCVDTTSRGARSAPYGPHARTPPARPARRHLRHCDEYSCCRWHLASHRNRTPSAGYLVQVLKKVVSRELDILVPPFGRPVDARDEGRPVYPPEVSVDERIPGLGFVLGSVGEPQVPLRVVIPAVPLAERVLVRRLGLD